ncbi:hypothetical protein [Granulicella sp. S190]|uniref:hypothetical protein n=1 Tax=Granulicella sp. S190 TaxID=1747226 RepID=UPI00131C96F7|nr:hypothetical protein [Granulicella sp. S190]
MEGVKPNSEGMLSFSATDLRFTTEQGSTDIARQRIIAVSSGDERVETGGTTAKIGRMLLPYGGGLAVATVTHKKVGLLTVEFLDVTGKYHGAVFALNTDDMEDTIQQLHLSVPPPYPSRVSAALACPAWEVEENAIRVEVVSSNPQSDFPSEDRVLLYERLLQQLKSEKTIQNVYRAGDQSPEGSCAEFTVTVRPVAFTKGDQAVRASVGPLGHFVGATKLSYHLTLSKQDGMLLFDGDMKNSEGSDSDSLNVTKVISKTVVKNLKKSRTKMRKTQSV